MADEYLLLETGDNILLETGDLLVLEVSGALVDLPLIDGGEMLPPTTTSMVTISLPLIDAGQVLAPTLTASYSTALPLIDGGEVFAPSIFEDQSLNLPLLEGGWVFAPLVTREGDEGVTVLVGGVDVSDDSFARSFEEQLADTGSFSFQMLRTDFLASSVDFDDVVEFRIDGIPRFRGLVEALDHTSLAQGEEADQTVTVSGRGILAEADNAVVYPSRGIGALPIEDVRSESWVSTDYSATASGWPYGKVVNRVASYAATGARRPSVFPNISGKWIWGNHPGVTALDAPQGINLFRQVLTLGSTQTVRFFFAGDNVMRLWIDATEITWFAGSAIPRFIDIELSAGGHVIAAKVANKTDVPGEDNPAGFIMAAYSLTADGLLDDLILETDGNWRVLPYPVRAPGFTVGKVIRLLFAEAGLDATWNLDFTDTQDSNGEPWTYQREITLNVGRSVLEALRELMDVHADIAVAPGSRTLRAWNRGTRGRVTSTVLQQTADPETSDFLALSHAGKRARMNKTLIRYADGHTETSTGAGDRTAYLELGHVTDEDVAVEYAQALMEIRAAPAFSTSATLHPRSSGSTPLDAFGVGDWVDCPDESDAVSSMRVNSIAWAEDEDGNVDWPVTLRDRDLDLEERFQVILQRQAMGYAVGGARVSSRAGTPAPSAQQVTVLKVAEFSYDNTALTVSTSPKRPAEESGNIVEVYGQLTTAGSTGTTVVVKKNGSTIATLSFAAGEDEDSVAVAAIPVLADTDKLQVQVTAAGTGAEGLDVQVRAI